MENRNWKHNAKLPITRNTDPYPALYYLYIKKGACQLVACYIIFSPTKKNTNQRRIQRKKERKKEICSEIDFSLSLSL